MVGLTVFESEGHGSTENGDRKLPGTATESGQPEESQEICRGLSKVCHGFLLAVAFTGSSRKMENKTGRMNKHTHKC